jgi:hypothetical protein
MPDLYKLIICDADDKHIETLDVPKGDIQTLLQPELEKGHQVTVLKIGAFVPDKPDKPPANPSNRGG